VYMPSMTNAPLPASMPRIAMARAAPIQAKMEVIYP
jgi:hypothetical protein